MTARLEKCATLIAPEYRRRCPAVADVAVVDQAGTWHASACPVHAAEFVVSFAKWPINAGLTFSTQPIAPAVLR